ncbi:hypothetical protein CBP25_14625, partial [Fischerella thermalis WC527]
LRPAYYLCQLRKSWKLSVLGQISIIKMTESLWYYRWYLVKKKTSIPKTDMVFKFSWVKFPASTINDSPTLYNKY